jgi:zinc transporter ZupT
LEAFCAAGFVFVSISQIVTVSVEEEEEEEEEEEKGGKHQARGNKRSYARDMMSVLLGVLVVYQVHAVFGCCGGHEEEGHHHHHHDEH